MEHTDRGALFLPATAAFTVSARWEYPAGWFVVVQHRHAGGAWQECEPLAFDHLSTEEVVDVLEAVVSDLLGSLSRGGAGAG
jgi:hypothetical protein